MLSAQSVAGVRIVVEAGRLPELGAVAGLALVTKLAFVALLVIVLAVTGNTGARGVLEVVVLVAVSAFDVAVFSGQRKACLVMVKLGLLPAVFAVAIGAFRSQRPLVYVIFAVAGIAFQWRVPVFFPGQVAFLTFHFLVLGAQ